MGTVERVVMAMIPGMTGARAREKGKARGKDSNRSLKEPFTTTACVDVFVQF